MTRDYRITDIYCTGRAIFIGTGTGLGVDLAVNMFAGDAQLTADNVGNRCGLFGRGYQRRIDNQSLARFIADQHVTIAVINTTTFAAGGLFRRVALLRFAQIFSMINYLHMIQPDS